MKGIVLQQAVYKGDVIGAEMYPMMKNPNQTYAFSEKTFNIPEEPLLSTSGYIIEEQKICPAQTIIITTTHLSEVPIKQIKKLKVYKKSQMEGYAKLKVQSQTTGKVMLLTAHDCQHFAITCFWMKLNSMNIQNDIKQEFINCCQGDVMKKSEILKVWEPRYLLITCKDGLMSFRDRKDGPTLVVQSIQEFWTRFQFVEGYKYVVFKFWHGIFKYEYAVPSHRAVKWFKAFYSLLTK